MRGARALAALGLALLAGCADEGDGPSPAPSDAWPADVVLAVDGLGITAAEVDRVAAGVGELFPAYTQPHRRRLALTNVVLPLFALRARHGEARERARERCEAAATAPTDELPEPEVQRGAWQAQGLDAWLTLRTLEVGAWSEPVELLGRWALLRVDEIPREGEWVVSAVFFPYLEPDQAALQMEAAIDASRLAFVDEDWRRYVPEEWQRRMGARRP